MSEQWSKFLLRVNVATSQRSAIDSWLTSAGLESWFLRKAIFRDNNGETKEKDQFIQEGDTYEWYWHGYPDNMVEKGRILDTNQEDRLVFTFSLGCPVTISVYEELGETIVQLVESDLPTDDETRLNHFVGDSKGWIFYLTNLKSILEGGIDLRNKRPELTNVIT